MWGQLPQLGTEQLFQTYLRSHCHLRSGRWGQSLLKYPRAFQFQGLHLLSMNTQRVALHPERACSEVYVNILPPAGDSWDGRSLGSGSFWTLPDNGVTRILDPGLPTMPMWWSRLVSQLQRMSVLYAGSTNNFIEQITQQPS